MCGRRDRDLHVKQQLRHLELRTRRGLRGRVRLKGMNERQVFVSVFVSAVRVTVDLSTSNR
jgi:hypothetical protein